MFKINFVFGGYKYYLWLDDVAIFEKHVQMWQWKIDAFLFQLNLFIFGKYIYFRTIRISEVVLLI